MQQQLYRCGDRRVDLTVPQVMGILNLTPDSFSDGGNLRSGDGAGVFFVSVEKALAAARLMLEQGAAIIDVGGESTRPGAQAVCVQEELDRVIPVVEALTSRLGAVVSVDTSCPQVMEEAARKGAAIINDVRALRRPGAVQSVVKEGLGVCLMHMQGDPATMQSQPSYTNVVEEVYGFLELRLQECLDAGIHKESILIDPGFGFGKTVQQNYLLLRNLRCFVGLGVPLLVGISRKSMIGQVLDKPPLSRMAGSLAAALYAVQAGVSIIRTHDVAETVDALKIHAAILAQG